MIDFNRPYCSEKEKSYILDAINSRHISGNGKYSKLVNSFFEVNYKIPKALVTTSCTDALEMAAMLCQIEENDEVIIPSYTFVSTALAFVREKARIIFADSKEDHPNIDENSIEELITEKTKAIVVVHYAGIACEMDSIISLAKKYNLFLIEDAAQAINAKYKSKYLGTLGDVGTFSFHETKNIQCGEGGLIAINNRLFTNRSEIIWEKGTNRSEFFRGEVNKYGWVDIGSSFLPSEITTAYLMGQLEQIDIIHEKRKMLWERYYINLNDLAKEGIIKLPIIPDYSSNNAHIFYVITNSYDERQKLIKWLRDNQIHAVFHYLALHDSPYYINKHQGRALPNAKLFEECLIRLPMYFELEAHQVDLICQRIIEFYRK